MSIPCKMRPVGLESLAMGEYKPAAFLESDGGQVIDTEIIPSGLSGYRAEVQLISSYSGVHYICGTQNGSGTPGFWFRTNSGSIVVVFDQSNRLSYTLKDGDASRKLSFEANFLNSRFLVVPNNKKEIGDFVYTWRYPFTLFKSRFGTGYDPTAPIRIFSWKHSDGTELTRNFIPGIDPAGIPCMFDLVSRQPFYNQGTGSDFIVGLTMKQALNLANLPAPTTINTLTISLPKEASLVYYNQEVEAALEAAAEKGWHIAVQYREEFEDESILNKYAECVTYADMVAVNPDFANDLTSDGEWCYHLPNLKYLNLYHENESLWSSGFWKGNKLIKKWSVELPAVTYAGSGFASSSIEVFDGGFPALVCPVYQYWAGKIESQGQRIFSNAKNLRFFRGDLSHARRLNMAFDSCSSLTEFHATLESLCMADGAFYGCQLDKPSALRILNSLPTKEYVDSVYTNLVVPRQKITIGIDVNLQNDEEVLTAITNAETNGWTLTVQWNPGGPTYTTPEVSTFGLRKPPIYAKLAIVEHPDGTSEDYLDWGHYVTNWEENGYQEFASIEEAEEHFNIKKEVEE